MAARQQKIASFFLCHAKAVKAAITVSNRANLVPNLGRSRLNLGETAVKRSVKDDVPTCND